MSGAPVGLALAPDRVVARTCLRTARGAPASWEVWSRDFDAGLEWEELRAALAEMRTALGSGRPLHLSLLPPLAQSRILEFPRLTSAELRAVLGRSVDRYFPGITEPQTTGAVALRRGGKGPFPVLATTASAHTVEALLGAAENAGWVVATITAAAVSWPAGAVRVWPELRKGDAGLIVIEDSVVHVHALTNGMVTKLRRVRLDVWDSTMISSTGPVAVVGATEEVSMLRAELCASGIAVLAPPEWSVTPAILAALGAPHGSALEVLPPRVYDARLSAARRLTRRLVGVAAALVFLAGAMHLWGLHREITAVEAERESIRADVQVAIEERELLDGLQARLAALSDLEGSSPRWSTVITELAVRLPRDAHIRSLRAVGDSLVLEGDATRSVGVFEALQQAPAFRSVRASAPIQQVRREGEDGASVERFTLGARISRGGVP